MGGTKLAIFFQNFQNHLLTLVCSQTTFSGSFPKSQVLNPGIQGLRNHRSRAMGMAEAAVRPERTGSDLLSPIAGSRATYRGEWRPRGKWTMRNGLFLLPG